jgi:Mn2+/Fe2+ NRAMP family transporter
MENLNTRLESDRRLLKEAKKKGAIASLGAFSRLSGPGWLQSAITLGGGSLASALYLGVLGGYSLLWLQGLAVILGVIMLGAISYVTLSTDEKPFPAINRHISPVLGWAWAIGTLMANMVWCLPQFSLSTAAVQQNLLPGLMGSNGLLGNTGGKIVTCAILWAVATAVVLQSGNKGKGTKSFEWILKGLVGLIVISFLGVVLKLTFAGALDWGAILKGFVPGLGQFSRPSESYMPFISAVSPEFQSYWTDKIVGMQQNVMIAAAAAAVGINQTFLMPYSMLNKGWNKDFRGLVIFDLSTGLAIPFIAVTSFVVIASASQFHTRPGAGLLDPEKRAPARLEGQYRSLLDGRLKAEMKGGYAGLTKEEKTARLEALPEADKKMAAMLVKRDAFNLAESLAPLMGNTFSKVIFGIGVLGMGLSTIIILMLISGFVICEIFGFPHGGKEHKWGCMLASVGVLGPFIWSGKTLFWLAVPTSVFCMMLLPIAYVTFFLMMNSKALMGGAMVRGARRAVWNVMMGLASLGALIAAGWSIWNRPPLFKWAGIIIVAALITSVFVVNALKKNRSVAS